MTAVLPVEKKRNQTIVYAGLVFLGVVAFSALFAWANLASYNWLSPQFERSSSPTVWGILQRLFVIIPATVIALWKPRQVGFQLGKTARYWKMLLIMLVLKVAVVGGYRVISGSTPYSGINMLINEVITVPLVEEIMWRGIVFAVTLAALKRVLPEARSGMLAAVFSGVCFGLLHSTNALFGYPLVFVALQTVNATVWGIVYGIARSKTGSVYPSIVLHAAMNLTVVLV